MGGMVADVGNGKATGLCWDIDRWINGACKYARGDKQSNIFDATLLAHVQDMQAYHYPRVSPHHQKWVEKIFCSYSRYKRTHLSIPSIYLQHERIQETRVGS